MDKEKVKEIFGEYWDGVKDKSLWNLSNKEFENVAYKQVAEELKQGDYKPHIQLKAVEKAKGNKEVIESLYIQFRVSEVTNELKAIASDYEAKVNAERRELEVKRKAQEKTKRKEKIKYQKAYESKVKNLKDLESEHDRRSKQTVLLTILYVVVIFILYLIVISP